MALWQFSPVQTTKTGKVLTYEAVPRLSDPLYGVYNRVAVLGSYATVCGGMDTISDKDVRLALLTPYTTKAHKRTLVFYEGLITGKTYGAMGALSEASAVPWLYVFMDTPFEVCAARVSQRRAERGVTAPFDPERTMLPTYRSCIAVAARAAAEGHTVLQVNHKLTPEKAAKELVKKIAVYTKEK